MGSKEMWCLQLTGSPVLLLPVCADRNMNMMAGAWAVILDHEVAEYIMQNAILDESQAGI